MIDFEITKDNQVKYLPWKQLCEMVGSKLYQPSTPELASIKMLLAKKWKLDPDAVVVRLNKQPIL